MVAWNLVFQLFSFFPYREDLKKNLDFLDQKYVSFRRLLTIENIYIYRYKQNVLIHQTT